MNFIKRAGLSLVVKKGRSLLLIGVFSAILIFILAGLTIKSASLEAAEKAKETIGATATLSVNREAMRTKMQEAMGSTDNTDKKKFEATPINFEEVTAISELSGIKSYNLLSSSSAAETDTLKAVKVAEETISDNEETKMPMGGNREEGGAGAGAGGGAEQSGDLTVSGVRHTDNLAELTAEGTEIIEGEGLSSKDLDTTNVLIEETLATANNLKVGDTIQLSDTAEEATTYEATVKGIYRTEEVADGMAARMSALNPVNKIIAPYTFVNTLKGEEYVNTVDSATYTLNNPKELAIFTEEATKLFDTETYELQTDDLVYQQMLKPISNITEFSKNIVLLVSVAGTIILGLIVMLTIRERKYEIGVLLSLGENRAKVLLQFFTELLLVLAVALVIAGVSGTFVGDAVGKQLQQQEVEAATEEVATNQFGGGEGAGPGGDRGGQFGGPNQTATVDVSEELEEMNITLSVTEILQLGGLGLVICTVAILISSVGILRLQPKNILTS